MKVTIDRNMCGTWQPACEECFGVFLAHGNAPDRACIVEAVDDGSPVITGIVRSGNFVGTLTIAPEDRETAIREGWRKFATLPDEAFDITLPHGEYIRAANKR